MCKHDGVHPARLIALILLAISGVFFAAGVTLILATMPNVDHGLSWFLFGVFCLLLFAAVVAMIIWLRDKRNREL